MPSSTYVVVTDTVTVPINSSGVPGTYSLTAPSGKKPLAGGFHDSSINGGNGEVRVVGSFPDGQDWVFKIIGDSGAAHDVDLYLVAAIVV